MSPGFGLVLGNFEQLFQFVVGGSVVPISARFPAPVPVPEEPVPACSEELLSVLHQVSQFDTRTPVKTKAEIFKENMDAKAREKEREAKDRDTRRRDRSPNRPTSPSSSEPPRKRRPSRLLIE